MPEAENLFYLIENKIVFIPDKQCLVHAESHEQIKLKPTASLCLLLLLRNHTEIVTQNELLAFAWGESHRQVSFNAFYQSILSLRKSFLQMNVEKQIITTIPRKGLLIQQEISVEEKRESLIVPEVDIIPTKFSGEVKVDNTRSKNRAILNLAEAIIIMFTMLIIGLLLYPQLSSDQYFSGYVESKNHGGQCHYFLNDDASNHIRHEGFIKQHPTMCNDDKYLYITAYPETKNISIIMCTTSMELSDGNSCQSVYYPRYESK